MKLKDTTEVEKTCVFCNRSYYTMSMGLCDDCSGEKAIVPPSEKNAKKYREMNACRIS